MAILAGFDSRYPGMTAFCIIRICLTHVATGAVRLLVTGNPIRVGLWNIVKEIFPGILTPEDGSAIEVMGIDETEASRINHLIGCGIGV